MTGLICSVCITSQHTQGRQHTCVAGVAGGAPLSGVAPACACGTSQRQLARGLLIRAPAWHEYAPAALWPSRDWSQATLRQLTDPAHSRCKHLWRRLRRAHRAAGRGSTIEV